MHCMGSGTGLTRRAFPLSPLMPLSVVEYDRLENAIVKGSRVALTRRGREYLVIPERLRFDHGREVILTRHPTTGHRLDIYVDELDHVEEMR